MSLNIIVHISYVFLDIEYIIVIIIKVFIFFVSDLYIDLPFSIQMYNNFIILYIQCQQLTLGDVNVVCMAPW